MGLPCAAMMAWSQRVIAESAGRHGSSCEEEDGLIDFPDENHPHEDRQVVRGHADVVVMNFFDKFEELVAPEGPLDASDPTATARGSPDEPPFTPKATLALRAKWPPPVPPKAPPQAPPGWALREAPPQAPRKRRPSPTKEALERYRRLCLQAYDDIAFYMEVPWKKCRVLAGPYTREFEQATEKGTGAASTSGSSTRSTRSW